MSLAFRMGSMPSFSPPRIPVQQKHRSSMLLIHNGISYADKMNLIAFECEGVDLSGSE